jgi:membrane protein YdbS with pleckstrin-like domain
VSDLLAGESLVMKLHRHWFLLFRYLLLPILLVIIVAVIDLLVGTHASSDARLALFLIALGIWGLWAIVAWVRWSAAALTITDQRVILEEGIFVRTTKVVALDRVTDVGTRRTPIGLLFDFGTLEIHTAAMGGIERFDHTPGPDAVRDKVFVLAGLTRRGR